MPPGSNLLPLAGPVDRRDHGGPLFDRGRLALPRFCVRILFWNLGRASLSKLVAEIAHREGVDLICLAESEERLVDLTVALNRGQRQPYLVPRGLPLSVRRELRILGRLPFGAIAPVHDGHGISARHIRPPSGVDFTLIVLHLHSKMHRDPGDQVFTSMRVRQIVDEAEARAGHRRTVIVGDLNMDPFERGVVAADGFHAVMSRRVAQGHRRKVDGADRYYFYNPMWSHFGDRLPSPPGTFYRPASGQTAYFWHMFDQVLVRPELLDYFRDDSLRIVSLIGATSLLTADGVPDAAFSDHLPIIFDLSIEKGTQRGYTEPLGETQAQSF